MEEKINILDDNTIDSENMQETDKKPLSISFVRFSVCAFILTVCFFIKIKNKSLFDSISIWYKNNICYQNLSLEYVFQKAESFIFEISAKLSSFWDLISGFRF